MAHNIIGGTNTASQNKGDRDTSPLVKAGRKQAKRLLRLSQLGQLNVEALHDAQGVVARLHGYPDWRALVSSANAKQDFSFAHGEQGETDPDGTANGHVKAGSGDRIVGIEKIEQVLIDPKTHPEGLCAAMGRLPEEKTSNVLTTHFDALRKELGQDKKFHFISMKDTLSANLLLSPLGSQKMLESHKTGVAEVLLEIIGGGATGAMRAIINRGIEQAFEGKSLGKNPVMFDLSEKPHWLSDKAFSLLRKNLQGKLVAYYLAEKALIEAGLMEDSWQCHIRAMPTIVDMAGEMTSDQVMRQMFGEAKGPNGTPAVEEVAEKLAQAYTQNIGSCVLDLPQDGVAVFQIDPLVIHREVKAAGRWMYAHMLGSLRQVNKFAHLSVGNLSVDAYHRPHETGWLDSVFPQQRDKVLGYLKEQQDVSGVDILDEMDGPMSSEVVVDMLTNTARENRKWGRGVWICLRNTQTKHWGAGYLNFLTSENLDNPMRLG